MQESIHVASRLAGLRRPVSISPSPLASRVLATAALLALALLVTAPAEASAAVRQLGFRMVRAPQGSVEWYEVTVEVEVARDATDPLRRVPDFIDNLRVELTLGIEVSYPDERPPFEFFVSAAELATAEEGRHEVRFYLPPAIVERDRVGGEPHSYVIRLLREDRVEQEYFSPSLERPEVRQSFMNRVEMEADRNRGVLLPQPLTPFLAAYPNATPSFRRAVEAP